MTQRDYYFIEDGLLLSGYGEHAGKGDVLFRSAMYAIVRGDYQMLLTISDLLLERRRWPRSMDDERGPAFEHRPRYDITRDPFIMFYCACMVMGRKQFIKCIKPPLKIRRPHLTSWRRYLITQDPKYLRRYERWASWGIRLNPRVKGFVYHLNCWMAWTAKSEKMQSFLQDRIPDWNLLQRELVLHPLRHLHQDAIHSYLPMEWYRWTWNNEDGSPYYSKKILPAGQDFYLDREILVWVYNRNIESQR